MKNKLIEIKNRYDVLSKELMDPDIYQDRKKYAKLAKEHSDLQEIVSQIDKYEKVESDLIFAEKSLKTETDPEMKGFFEQEISNLKLELDQLEKEIKLFLIGKDEDDEKNVILEIRGGAGGEEAALFAADLKRMYEFFADKQRLSVEILDINETELGGIKECTMLISGKDAYSLLKYESGVHRVQRVPDTESQGRVHTSTVTVAVLPENKDVEIDINEKDIQVDTYRSSGAGGQHVNKTESAVRLTHIPTGIVVACQQERSQIKNKEKAFEILKSKLYDFYKSKSDADYAEKRKMQVGTGDRSEKIRTYNYPQNRITDHRINLSIYSMSDFLNGDLMPIIGPLKVAEQTMKLTGAQ